MDPLWSVVILDYCNLVVSFPLDNPAKYLQFPDLAVCKCYHMGWCCAMLEWRRKIIDLLGGIRVCCLVAFNQANQLAAKILPSNILCHTHFILHLFSSWKSPASSDWNPSLFFVLTSNSRIDHRCNLKSLGWSCKSSLFLVLLYYDTRAQSSRLDFIHLGLVDLIQWMCYFSTQPQAFSIIAQTQTQYDMV